MNMAAEYLACTVLKHRAESENINMLNMKGIQFHGFIMIITLI